MKTSYLFIISIIFLFSCTQKTDEKVTTNQSSIVGTWKLLKGTIIQGKDTSVTDYTAGREFIKIINDTHFAFLHHDLLKGKDSSAVFVAGGGTYTLEGNKYTEHLQYCNFREWEDHKFEFEVSLDQDTLVVQGIEKIEKLNVDQVNIEKYVRMKSDPKSKE